MDFPLIEPIDYFSGEKWDGSLPENVLIFTRLDRRGLDNQYIHHHSRYNLIISLEGSCRILIDRKILYIPSQSVVLIHPWQTFRFLYDNNQPIKWLFFGFDWKNGDHFSGNSVKMASKSVMSYCKTIMQRHTRYGTGPWLIPYLMILLEEMTLLPVQNLHTIPVKDEGMDLLLKIQKYILDHLREDISVSQIADLCSYSESRLRTIFKENMGTSLGSYIRQSKMNNAAKKLGLSELSVTEISELCGFSSVYSFSRGFKNLYGVSPMKYRIQAGK